MKCLNICCKYYLSPEKCSIRPYIAADGHCAKFKRGIVWYFNIVWEVLEHKNYVDAVEMTPDLRIGLYYVMTVFHLGFSVREWGTCRLFTLHTGEGGIGLRYEDIIKLPIDEKALANIKNDFDAGKLPIINTFFAPKKASQSFGWLSPMGDFSPSDFGNHEESAKQICCEKLWESEYQSWSKAQQKIFSPYRDFLVSVKGYCLIHNPTNDGGYIVTHIKPCTKAQRTYLYNYFMDLGDRFKAEQFLKNE